jgi:hypothetical protein
MTMHSFLFLISAFCKLAKRFERTLVAAIQIT